MRIKIANLTLCISLILRLIIGFDVYAETEISDYGEKAFDFLQAVGMLDSDTVYEPDAQVDRGLFAKLAVEFSGCGVNDEDSGPFEDIEGSEYRPYIISAYKHNYIAGVD